MILAGDDLRAHAARLVALSTVGRDELAVAFGESTAQTAVLHVEGRNFYPHMLADIDAAESSIHINQFGFRPGNIGDRFARVLESKAQEGVPVRMVVDRQGSDPRAARGSSTSASSVRGSRSV